MTDQQKRRVYLSKSNQADPSDVGYVRGYLQGLGYEVVEHIGGTYDPSLLGTCAYMVMVGWDTVNEKNEIFVGKGQYDQYKERKRQDFHYNYYTTKIDRNGKPIFRSILGTGMTIKHQDWSHQYGTFYVKMDRFHSALTVISHAPKKIKIGARFNQADGNGFGDMGKKSSYEYAILNLGKDRKISLAAVSIVRNFKI